MKDRIITIAEFNQVIEAHIAKTRIEADGIECYIINEGMNWLYANAITVKLQVKESDLKRAIEILQYEEEEEH